MRTACWTGGSISWIDGGGPHPSLTAEMTNYEFCARWVMDQRQLDRARVLDYGCGGGEIVRRLRDSGVEAFGCDVFYEGGNYSVAVGSELFESGIVRRIDGGTIPFDDESFDYVLNNQVMEHVEDLDAVLGEIRRVMKPGGILLSLFPDRGVWREGHCGIPFLHWFPKESGARVWYATALRLLGLGHHTAGLGPYAWSRGACSWLDRWTHYRPRHEINALFDRHFVDICHIEDDWLELRYGRRYKWVHSVPRFLRRLVVRKLGGLVFTARKVDRD